MVHAGTATRGGLNQTDKAQIWCVELGPVARRGRCRLARSEGRRLAFARGHSGAAHFGDVGSRDWLAMERLRRTAVKVRVVALALKGLHELDADDCPFNETLSEKLARAEVNVRDGWIDELDFDENHRGRRARTYVGRCKVFDPQLRTLSSHMGARGVSHRGDNGHHGPLIDAMDQSEN